MEMRLCGEEPWKMAVVGAGYVGTVTAVGMAELGNQVKIYDIDEYKMEQLYESKTHLYEPGIDSLLLKHRRLNNIYPTDCIGELIEDVEIVFICVGTPNKPDGGINLDYVKSACKDLKAAGLKENVIVVMKSTVIPGTTDGIIKKEFPNNPVAFVPEFLREGAALEDFMKPDRIVIGTKDSVAEVQLGYVYSFFDCPKVFTDARNAEMIKYASNSFMGTKISFINEIAGICEKTGCDVEVVAKGMGLSSHIGEKALHAGPGWGGSCFPKDSFALARLARAKGIKTRMIDAARITNNKQAIHVVDMCGEVKGRKVAVLGLTFKANTDDCRDSPALRIVDELKKRGATLSVYDPKASMFGEAMRAEIAYCPDVSSAINKADIVVVATEWDEFTRLHPDDFEDMRGTIIVDARRILNPGKFKRHGFDYRGIGYGKSI